MSDRSLQKYYLRLATEGLIKALLWGLSIGFSILAILGGIFWFMAWKAVWICLLVWAVVSAGTTYALYRWRFKPTTKYIARRVDDLGLHERILTMTELEGDESYIAQRQREDANAALQKVAPELLKIGVSVRTIVCAAVACVLGAGVAVVAFLGAAGIIPTGQDLLHPDGPDGPVIKYTIKYEIADGMGTIQGEMEQTVVAGEYTTGVVAVPADNWAFLRWSDGSTDPYRSDLATEDKTYTVVFESLKIEGLGGLEDEMPDDAPGDQLADDNNNESDENGNEAAGKFEEVNQVIDGKTYYGNVYEEAYKDAMDDLTGKEYSEDAKGVGSGYFENIEKGEEATEENE